jgi:hypothetical protein
MRGDNKLKFLQMSELIELREKISERLKEAKISESVKQNTMDDLENEIAERLMKQTTEEYVKSKYPKMYCEFIFKKGTKKGKVCGKFRCATHNKEYQLKKKMRFEDIESDSD